MTHRVERNKWILYRHTSDLDLALAVGKYFREYGRNDINTEQKKALLLNLKNAGLYNERNPGMPLDALNHKINTLCFFMFGYKQKLHNQEKFLFSPLGNLYFNNLTDTQKRSKIFLTMLWAIQFQHPHSGTSSDFQLYPFRLIYKLFMDERLGNYLQAFEVAYLVPFVERLTEQTYEKLVQEILELRSKSKDEIIALFHADRHSYVNAVYEWDYYVSKVLESQGVLERQEGQELTRLQHGTTQTFRQVTDTKVSIPAELRDFCKTLLDAYPAEQAPLLLNDPERIKSDVIKEIYAFYPEELLKEIDEYDEDVQSILELPKLIEQYANNNAGEEAYLFEDVLEEGFNQFFNVEAKKIGGAGQTDVECLYLTQNKKFSVDAKSTKNKLSGLNAGRLDHHRQQIGGKYTIVVTPRYVPAVKQDIKNSKIVILLASTFSEFLYNNMINNVREIDYANFDTIIESSLGTDISSQISDLTLQKFGTDNVIKS